MECQVGDWVCFQQLGSLSYGEVIYVIEDPYSSLGKRVVTTSGEFREKDALEVRRKVAP